ALGLLRAMASKSVRVGARLQVCCARGVLQAAEEFGRVLPATSSSSSGRQITGSATDPGGCTGDVATGSRRNRWHRTLSGVVATQAGAEKLATSFVER